MMKRIKTKEFLSQVLKEEFSVNVIFSSILFFATNATQTKLFAVK